MMTFFAIIYLILMCCVAYVIYKKYDEFMEGINSRKKRIMINIVTILLTPIVCVIGIIELLIEELKK